MQRFEKKTSFNSHTKCYVDNGFCNLSFSDYREITKLVGNALTPFSGSAWLTSLNGGSTLASCARRYASAILEIVFLVLPMISIFDWIG